MAMIMMMIVMKMMNMVMMMMIMVMMMMILVMVMMIMMEVMLSCPGQVEYVCFARGFYDIWRSVDFE